jgi:glycosyltransferase involved in cell wall biosynthesis
VTHSELPRLLYLCDIPPETTPGNAAMYRLLQDYPADRLIIALGNIQRRRSEQQLMGARYQPLRTALFPRLLYTRFSQTYAAWLYRSAPWKSYLAKTAFEAFEPEAIFTVAQNFSWLIADAISQKHGIPLHLAVWDDFVRMANLPAKMRDFAEQRFGEVYRRAASRLCISPNMAEHFANRYGVSGTVLYPPRAADLPTFDAPPPRIGRKTGALTFAFAGSVNYGPYAKMIGALARVLGDQGHSLLVFGGIDEQIALRSGIAGPHIKRFPLLPFSEVLSQMRRCVDALFVPMTFEQDMALDMHISFPSKLTDYTAVGVPLLIWGPPTSSAARWMRENPGAGVLVDQHDEALLRRAVSQLASSGAERLAMGRRALEVGDRMFDHAAVTGQLYSIIAASIRTKAKADMP